MKKNKIKFLIFGLCCISLFLLFIIDKKFFMNDRILLDNWEYDRGYYSIGMINGQCSKINGDTLFANMKYKCIIVYSYNNTLVIRDIKTNKKTYFSSIGSNW
jgi:hypothetical protein